MNPGSDDFWSRKASSCRPINHHKEGTIVLLKVLLCRLNSTGAVLFPISRPDHQVGSQSSEGAFINLSIDTLNVFRGDNLGQCLVPRRGRCFLILWYCQYVICIVCSNRFMEHCDANIPFSPRHNITTSRVNWFFF